MESKRPFSQLDWLSTPEPVRAYIVHSDQVIGQMQQLCHWSKKPPNEKQWTDFYSRLLLLLILHEGVDDKAGQLARSIGKELESLRVFLERNGADPTNDRSERALRFAVLWRKRSNGTQGGKVNRWVERILSLKQTCRMRALPVLMLLMPISKIKRLIYSGLLQINSYNLLTFKFFCFQRHSWLAPFISAAAHGVTPVAHEW